MLRAYPDLKEQEARQHLGSFGVGGTLALQPLYTLSGGQKSRVAFAKVRGGGRCARQQQQLGSQAEA
jgi:ATP-binding cassette subfamily F protein 3